LRPSSRVGWEETNDPHETVIHALASTARVIASAAMIMVSVFLTFIMNDDPIVKQFGLGMAVAVVVDATVVRRVLVPVIISLLGSVGCWLPKWMERTTPKFSIEGNEWFAEHETPAPLEKTHHNRIPKSTTNPTASTDRCPQEPYFIREAPYARTTATGISISLHIRQTESVRLGRVVAAGTNQGPHARHSRASGYQLGQELLQT
jgi:hypothetical protein